MRFRLQDLKTTQRLGVGFGALVLMMVLLATAAWIGLRGVHDSMSSALTESRRLSAAQTLQTTLNILDSEMWGLVTASNADDRLEHQGKVSALRDEYKRELARLKGECDVKGVDLLGAIEQSIAGGREMNLRVAAAVSRGATQQAIEQLSEVAAYRTRSITPSIEALITHQASRAREAEALAEQASSRAKWTLVLGILAASVAAVVLGRLVSLSIVVPLRDCINYSGLLSTGDFSVDVPMVFRERLDEIGELANAYHTMVTSIRKLLSELIAGVQNVASAAIELSAATEEMSTTTDDIARTTESQRLGSEAMAAAVVELAASIDEVGKSAQHSMSLMKQAMAAAQHGNEAGGDTKSAMDDVVTAAGQITGAITVISEISNLTSLLSLNAAIEAAKAGEHGKGFAVVAEEVRKLADRSSVSVKSIATHIDSTRKAVTRGTDTVSAMVESLAQIHDSLEQFAAKTQQVAVATLEQSKAGNEVAKRVELVSSDSIATASAASQMAATTQEVARTVSSLAQTAENLRTMANRFKI